MPPSPPAIVFAHLDGTLLDPYTYPLDTVLSALERLDAEHLPVVLYQGRTRAELELIQHQLGLHHPFVCESGAAVFVPKGYFDFDVPHDRDVAGFHVIESGDPYDDVVESFRRVAERLEIEVSGFSDLSVEELAKESGLPMLQARLAKLREYDEPFRMLQPTPALRSRLVRALQGARLACMPGARYEYVGASSDRGVGLDLLCALYERAFGSIQTIGLGDGVTDRLMFSRVDTPIVMRHTNWQAGGRTPADVLRPNSISGSANWVGGINAVVQGGCRVESARL